MINPGNVLRVERRAVEPVDTPAAEPVAPASAGCLLEGGGGQLEPRLMLPRIRIDAFAEADDLVAVLNAVAGDRRSVRSEFAVHRGSFPEAMARYRGHPPADLILIEHSESAGDLVWAVEALAELCAAETRLIVIGDNNDVALYRTLIKMGVSDYLVRPVSTLALLDSILSVVAGEEEDPASLGMVLAFVGSRGGAGSSTVAHNVAAALGKCPETSTLLIDADIGFGTAGLQFDISCPHNFSDAAKEGGDLNRDLLEKLIHWRDKRFGVLTSPDRPDQVSPPAPGVMRHIVEQARRLTKYIVLDLPHGWTPWTAEALGAADRVGLVATPDLPSLRNTRTLLAMIGRIRPNDEPPYLILNKVPARRKPPVAIEDFERTLEKRVATAIPFDDAAPVAEMAGRVLVEEARTCAAASAIEALANNMTGRSPATAGAKRSKIPFAGLLRLGSK